MIKKMYRMGCNELIVAPILNEIDLSANIIIPFDRILKFRKLSYRERDYEGYKYYIIAVYELKLNSDYEKVWHRISGDINVFKDNKKMRDALFDDLCTSCIEGLESFDVIEWVKIYKEKDVRK